MFYGWHKQTTREQKCAGKQTLFAYMVGPCSFCTIYSNWQHLLAFQGFTRAYVVNVFPV